MAQNPPDPSSYGFKALLGRDITALSELVITASVDDAQPFAKELNSFGIMAHRLLNLDSVPSQQSPQVSQVLRSRLKAAFDKRGEVNFSLCECPTDEGLASHDNSFQEEFRARWRILRNLAIGHERTTAKYVCMCPELEERVQIYGVLGEGTFGIAFLARDKDVDADYDRQKFAIKVQPHMTEVEQMIGQRDRPEMVTFEEPTGHEHYIPEEALILIYLSNSKRFPTIDSIYTHGIQWSIVMHPCVDPTLEDKREINFKNFLTTQQTEDGRSLPRLRFPRFPAFSGVYLKGKRKRPVVDEMQGCKIAGQFLQGMIQLADMRVYHHDISINNYLVDQNLNVQLIDLGQVDFSLTDLGFQTELASSIPFFEYQLRPELAIEFMKYDQKVNQMKELEKFFMPQDLRRVSLWKYSAIIYGFLHGYWPWEDTNPEVIEWHGIWKGYPEVSELYEPVVERRRRMINEDISVSESLSQDCRDVLQSALSRDKDERPSLQEMNSFPWFSQWSAEECESGRPFKRPRIRQYWEDNRGYGRKRRH